MPPGFHIKGRAVACRHTTGWGCAAIRYFTCKVCRYMDTQTQSICFIALLLPYTKDRGNALNMLLVTIYCYGMLTAVKWLTGVAKRPDPTRWTLAVSSHGVTTTTIQALALLLAFETMKTLRTGCWRYTYTLKYINWTSFSDVIPLLLSYVFHSTFQSSLVNKYRHRSHARTLLHYHTGICDDSPGRRNPLDTLENAMKTSENARFVFPGNVNGCSYFDHSVVPCSLLHSGTAQSQGHSCPRCSCSHTGWRSSAPSVPPHKLPQSIHAPLHQIINSHSTTEITLWEK